MRQDLIRYDADRREAAASQAELHQLIGELDRPLIRGFVTAGYGALGRFAFLATEARTVEEDRTPAI